ncbi:DUF6236 family protein [Streptomyces sp. NPDC093064]|uniref:DUF6236 family protein n=1 Tax=Streptomyces sp. NPDC093064 TaxID=3366020 RepID=UPI00382E6DA2
MIRKIGLYYPYIHFRDLEWLKLSALYWPKLARVVPEDYPVSDSPTATALADELDFFVHVDPSRATSAVAERFLDVITHHADPLRWLYGARDRDPVEPETGQHAPPLPRHAVGPRRTRSTPGLTGVYWDEVTPELRAALFQSGLAVQLHRLPPAPPTPRPWIGVDPALAWVYKCALTEELARQGQFTPTTDQTAALPSSCGWDTDRIIRVLFNRDGNAMANDVGSVVGMMAIRIAVPASSATLPIAKIVEIRQRCHPEFNRFAEVVDSTVSDMREQLSEIKLAKAANAYLQLEVDRRFEVPLQELRRAMRGLKVDTAFSAANLSFEVPAAVASVAGGVLAGQPFRCHNWRSVRHRRPAPQSDTGIPGPASSFSRRIPAVRRTRPESEVTSEAGPCPRRKRSPCYLSKPRRG